MNSFYNEDELRALGFALLGGNVLISKKCSIYNPEKISIGSNVRIDDFCLLSGDITIGNYVHISAFSCLYGRFGIKIGNFCGISPRCSLFSASDDFSGEFMISPMVKDEHINLKTGVITLENYSQIGANSILMPAVTIKEGAVCAAFSFVKTSLESWSMNKGIKEKKYKDRRKNVKFLAEKFYKNEVAND